jgi:quinol monooxygenase YgiN
MAPRRSRRHLPSLVALAILANTSCQEKFHLVAILRLHLKAFWPAQRRRLGQTSEDSYNTCNRPAPEERANVTRDLAVFARFHAKEGFRDPVDSSIQEVLEPTRLEAGCVSIHAFNAIQDPRLFYIHSRWKDEPAFDHHAQLPHTVRFLEKVRPLIDHPLDITRTRLLA